MFCLSLVVSACSAIQPVDAGGPRTNQPVYPVVLSDNPARSEATLNATKQLIGQQAQIRLQPVTATILSLGSNTNAGIYLPKVGAYAEMTEEETRESLRRFISEWRSIIGADPEDLSLVAITDQQDGTRLAEYQQRPFRFPLRGGYGSLRIRFGLDRRLVDVISTTIPDADHLQPSLAQITAVVTSEDAVKLVSETGVNYTSANGQTQIVKPAAADMDARELVFYVMPPTPSAPTLEFHLAWEVLVKNSAVKNVYVDAVKGQILAAS